MSSLSDEFKEKLQNYAKGNLSPEEKAEFELELKKLEEYQVFLEAELEDNGPQETQKKPDNPEGFTDKKEAWIIKKAKWKARVQNALTALSIVFIGTILCSVITAIYYSTGNPSKIEVYRDVVRSTIAITEPNVQLRSGGTSVKPFFNMELKGELQKKIGSDEVNAGEIEMSFLFSQASFPNTNKLLDSTKTWPFVYPTSTNQLNSDWEKLEKLPEGTVAEAYLSFDKFYPTDQVLQKFKGRDMRPVWFVVDTGFDDVTTLATASFIGFPYEPLWHHDDMTVTSHTEQKGWLFGKTVLESAGSPSVEEYGSAKLRNENFLKTLELIKKYEKIANRIAPLGNLKIAERIKYLNSHGVKMYGIVVTGPSKEILKLQKESWVAGVYLGEVRLWNWERRQ